MKNDGLTHGNFEYRIELKIKKLSRLITAQAYSKGHRKQILHPGERHMKMKDIEKYAEKLLKNVPDEPAVLNTVLGFYKTKVMLPVEKKGKKAELALKRARTQLYQIESEKIEEIADMDKVIGGLFIETIKEFADKFDQGIEDDQEAIDKIN